MSHGLLIAHAHQPSCIKVRGREREDWVIQLANREGGVAEEAIRVFLVEGGRSQEDPGVITRV